ncbi:TPA: GNAT family N-acetyltransferase [Burkholderia multivorans]|uniref:GNAT family N-acetyltransferase n=1 Tax=Burkholderia multivorans TaxID=87883 RepID=UPI0015889C32|nr:GNAT family N-acetyltransferase [Burkholderia multivorans]MBU9315469.1 GNAT family N-acetyltransferase [Burkholderia multivorans]MBU9583689.1 GNAT family N-acetyltransferase [Burkholderia multivorans]MBU9666634.1 GNAT family N-acetyltransferase [Burkholderia multivorans]MDN7936696.1 GNAT family N-acetyltransferase [Burkholderia multivorans]HEF4744482.1 GNAT family N-acetyltransferase [Burkholderia multivorans]
MLQMRPMTAGEFRAYRARAIEGYARDLVASGQNPTDDAAPRAQRCFDTLLPDGLSTPGQTLVLLVDSTSGETVGDLWYAIVTEGPHRTLFIYDLDIVPSRRRQRWATRVLEALEAEARRYGVTEIGLSVFNHNVAARALYRACGFVPITTTLIKPVVSS